MAQSWDNYYFMMGSAGAGLIGLLFVVVTLTAGFERSQAERGASLYMTPTALHFAVVLSTSAVGVAPGLGAHARALVFGLVALVGLANAVRACIGISRPREGMPIAHWSDVWMYGGTPAVVYVGLCIAALGLWVGAGWADYAMAGLLLILLLVGIRNAWDLVTWIAPKRNSDAG